MKINILKLYPTQEQATRALKDALVADQNLMMNATACYVSYDCGVRVHFRSGDSLNKAYDLAGMCFLYIDFYGVIDKEVKDYVLSRVRY